MCLWCLYQRLVNPVTLALRIIERYRLHLLSRSQHAYIKGKSVESALHDVTCFVEVNFARGEYTLAAFLVIEGAFNNVITSSIENSLRDIHAPDGGFITHMEIWVDVLSPSGQSGLLRRGRFCPLFYGYWLLMSV